MHKLMSTIPEKERGILLMKVSWQVQARLLKRRFPLLTDDDLHYVPGEENNLLKRMGSRLNKDRDEVIRLIKQSQNSTT